ncbi:stage V sporulation protein M [Fructilactobacillus lindneri]|uniref:Protein cfxQ-like protein n=2 Tax=Fructilactobacillus lindneri TaxID=53444 RepID=A0A0R2JNP1_9LACO|nr:AAA family ATPase [Fructilactobacillus lindneri]ANZ57776.1 stage V sporulation protein M [Fructilactobacillus lindneri]ANZ59045.1 stage V sporulation protein M [Fructilactobacillus lindneri]KRN78783.1 protein cfxQ-like protein [Fructilactobacillus lindneri DSM 20690 = JCM 11027]POG98098.1 stage V sporulation protein M [Fructilactobacillus lindneri]POH01787.1 stage V sporulation protein M [Fructilactobacillus lindneri]
MTFEELKEYGQLFYRSNYKLDSNLETKTFKIKNIKSNQHVQNDEGGFTDWTDNMVTLYNLLSPVIGDTFGYNFNFKKREMYLYFPLKQKTTAEKLNQALPLVDLISLEQDDSSNIATVDISKFNDRYEYAAGLYDNQPLADLDLSNLTDIKNKTTDSNSDNNEQSSDDLNLNIEKLDTSIDALKELENLTGLESAKKQITDMIAIAKVNNLREKHGLKVPAGISKHMVFVGDPGTGKTTVAKLFATILYQNGIIKDSKFVNTDRSDLVGHYTGTTADRTKKVIQSSLGGVLFIDEAYQLSHPDSPTDFGHEAIDQLIIGMENHRKDLIVILAGYTNEMEEFLNDNPGLRSRIPNRIFFADYSTDELVQILFKMITHDEIVKLSDEKYFQETIKNFIEKHQPTGNARWARNVYQAMLQAQARRVAFQKDEPSTEDLTNITNDDLDQALATTPTN